MNNENFSFPVNCCSVSTDNKLLAYIPTWKGYFIDLDGAWTRIKFCPWCGIQLGREKA